MSVSQIVFVLGTINDVERAVRIQVCILGSPYTLFLYNWKSVNYKDILVMTEKFNGKKKKIHEMEATVSKEAVRKSYYSTRRRIQDTFSWS